MGVGACAWGEALQRYGGRQGQLLALEDCEYPVLVRGGKRAAGGLQATPAQRGYVPLQARAMGASVEDRWSSLPEQERRDIAAKHPHNAPKLEAHVGKRGSS